MPEFKVKVLEKIARMSIYYVDAETQNEAWEKAKNGDTVNEKNDDLNAEVENRIIVELPELTINSE